jgi:hypothetical protein
LSGEHVERRLAAILAADVAVRSRLMGAERNARLLISFKKRSSIPKSLSFVDTSRRLALRSQLGDKRMFAGIAGPQSYSGKNSELAREPVRFRKVRTTWLKYCGCTRCN